MYPYVHLVNVCTTATHGQGGREGGENRRPYGDLSQGDPTLLPLAVLRASVGQPREPQGEGSLRCNLRAGARHRRRDTDRGPQFHGGLTSKARLGGRVKVEPVRSQGSQMNHSGTQEGAGAAGTEWARAVPHGDLTRTGGSGDLAAELTMASRAHRRLPSSVHPEARLSSSECCAPSGPQCDRLKKPN